jgi:hypothetical protein
VPDIGLSFSAISVHGIVLSISLIQGIMAGAITVLGMTTGEVGKLRNYKEFSLDWEKGLKHFCGVIPPRTHIEPYIAPLHPVLVDREIPLYHSGALLSQIVPGGKLDPYANPPPTPEQIEKEKQRLASFLPSKKDKDAAAPVAPWLVPKSFVDENVPDEEAYWAEARQRLQVQRDWKQRHAYRGDPMAEYYRAKAYAALHPELTLDEAKMKVLLEERKYKW